MMNQKSSATPRTVERFARRPLLSRSGFPDRFVSGFNAMGRLFAVKVHAAGESTFWPSSARRIFRRHASRDGQSARCGDASHSVTVTESQTPAANARRPCPVCHPLNGGQSQTGGGKLLQLLLELLTLKI
jgi:hypothetical protein